jgi:Cu-Zn family superoxide dismutase
MRRAAALVFAALLGGCALFPQPGDGPVRVGAPQAERSAWIVGVSGHAIGQATFRSAPGGVLIRLEFSERALPPGWHGVHLHQVGDCADFASGFLAAGPHLGAQPRVSHGYLHAAGPEAGDLPNLFASPQGVFGAEFFAPYAILGPDRVPGNANRRERVALLDADGAALVIHAAPDDHASQPIGNAGARIACAALTPLP